MAESSWLWGGTTTGDAGPYTDDSFSDLWSSLFQSDRTLQGPLKGLLGELLVTNPSGTTIRLASGWAVVDGKVYKNTANLDFVVSVPASTKYYRLVLRKSFTAQTVKAAVIGPVDGTYPALTQTDGTTWEIPLAHFTITSGGVVTLLDVRTFCQYSTNIVTTMINNSNVTYEKLAPGASKFANRQGGSATDWTTPGNNNYTPSSSRLQGGVKDCGSIAANTVFNQTVTFPVAFSQPPIVLLTPVVWSGTGPVAIRISSTTTTQVQFAVHNQNPSLSVSAYVDWIAVGAE